MSVTEYKRKSKRRFFLFGMLVVFIPACICIISLGTRLLHFKKKNQDLEKKLGKESRVAGYILTRDVEAGQKIEADMLRKITLGGEGTTFIQPVEGEELIGKCVKSDFAKGTAINPACVYEENEYSLDMRIKTFDFMELNSMIQPNDFIDIRITYPNGEDYVIVKHKRVLGITGYEESQDSAQSVPQICLEVTEEEILRITSAYVDTVCYPNARIYTVSYMDQFQQAGMVNYPVNPDVFQLLGWNPNVLGYVSSAEEEQHRNCLEANLSDFGLSEAGVPAGLQDSVKQE